MKDVKKLSIFQENSNTGKWAGLELFQVKISVDAKGTSLDSHTYNQGRLGPCDVVNSAAKQLYVA